MNEQDGRFAPLGQHLIHIEGDTLVMVLRGVLTGEDGRQLLDHFARIKREHGALFVIYDGRQCTSIDAAARRLATHNRSNDGYEDVQVAFGVPYAIRVLVNMILRAQKLLVNRDVMFHIFASEKEARAFVDKERARIHREKGLKTPL
jgi:hypothetical protein